MGFADQMISSIKNNSRRNRVHIPFEQSKTTEKKPPLKSKKYSLISKNEIHQTLKKGQTKEKENLPIKILITLMATLIVISGIVFIIKFTFF